MTKAHDLPLEPPAHELPAQVRDFDDVPSLLHVVRDHFQKREA